MLRAGLFDFAREEENPLSNITYTDKKENQIIYDFATAAF
jgi:hypothetical protein